MPSIPQSLLWISLVVLWLFVLVPMLISKRDAVRRTSDVALATRVLNSGAGAAQCGGAGPRPGHHSDPDWQPDATTTSTTTTTTTSPCGDRARPSVTVGRRERCQTEPEYLDVDVVEEDSGALPVGASARGGRRGTRTATGLRREHRDVLGRRPRTRSTSRPSDDSTTAEPDAPTKQMTDEFADASEDDTDYEYEYVEDTSGLEAPSDTDLHVAGSKSQARRRTLRVQDRGRGQRPQVPIPQADADGDGADAAGHRRGGVLVSPASGGRAARSASVTMLYLGYLRRQTRIEEQVRRRRAQRMARSRLGVENTARPRVRRRPVAAAPARFGGAGDRRRGPDLRAPGLRAVRARVRPAAGRGAVAPVFSGRHGGW